MLLMKSVTKAGIAPSPICVSLLPYTRKLTSPQGNVWLKSRLGACSFSPNIRAKLGAFAFELALASASGAGLEPVPEGLIKRMQRVGGTGGLHEDASGGSNDVQCSVCWDSLLDAEREGFGSEAPAQQQSDAVEAQSEQQTEATASTTSNAPSESSDAGVSNANGPTPSPAQGIYLFYRSSPVDR